MMKGIQRSANVRHTQGHFATEDAMGQDTCVDRGLEAEVCSARS